MFLQLSGNDENDTFNFDTEFTDAKPEILEIDGLSLNYERENINHFRGFSFTNDKFKM